MYVEYVCNVSMSKNLEATGPCPMQDKASTHDVAIVISAFSKKQMEEGWWVVEMGDRLGDGDRLLGGGGSKRRDGFPRTSRMTESIATGGGGEEEEERWGEANGECVGIRPHRVLSTVESYFPATAFPPPVPHPLRTHRATKYSSSRERKKTNKKTNKKSTHTHNHTHNHREPPEQTGIEMSDLDPQSARRHDNNTGSDSEAQVVAPAPQRRQRKARKPRQGGGGPLGGGLPTDAVGNVVGSAVDTVGNTLGSVGDTAGGLVGGVTGAVSGGGGGGKEGGKDTLRLRLDLNLEIEVTLKARIHGDLTLALL